MNHYNFCTSGLGVARSVLRCQYSASSKVWFPFWPGLTGQKLYAQQIHSDRHQNGLFFAVSNGMETRIPSPPSGRLPISRLMTTNVNASSGTINANYGVVTEFMH